MKLFGTWCACRAPEGSHYPVVIARVGSQLLLFLPHTPHYSLHLRRHRAYLHGSTTHAACTDLHCTTRSCSHARTRRASPAAPQTLGYLESRHSPLVDAAVPLTHLAALPYTHLLRGTPGLLRLCQCSSFAGILPARTPTHRACRASGLRAHARTAFAALSLRNMPRTSPLHTNLPPGGPHYLHGAH